MLGRIRYYCTRSVREISACVGIAGRGSALRPSACARIRPLFLAEVRVVESDSDDNLSFVFDEGEDRLPPA